MSIFVSFKASLEGLFSGCRSVIGVDGIEKALTDLWPKVQRRYYCRHLSANWKKSFHGPKLWKLFWLACGAFSTFTFAKAMNEIEKNNPDARRWLANLGPQERWTKHKFDSELKCDVNKTNFVKSFNATLGTDRFKPVLSLLEGIRRITMVRLAARRQKCEEWERLCLNIAMRVQVLCNESRSCRAFMSSPGEYEVVEGKSTLAVSLNQCTCLCNIWQLTSIPCRHAMIAILHEGLDPQSLVDDWYSVENYKFAYHNSIKPIPDQDKWPATEHPTILPPMLSRPCRNRKRGDDEERKAKRSKTIKCGKCGDFGHNKASCKGGATKKQKAAAPNTDDASTSKCKGKSKAK
ncbi:uncharacterized protein LOC130807433 [Amaranthus tricolor]|uniref:uncharacterized protein LOC130807433 n=1 Tax=Amaranthus tricolor TaxID=29722 RepID=UPI00258A5F43|nr:uncharacterized protein LOC130807433 [Amaranthus tricolor]